MGLGLGVAWTADLTPLRGRSGDMQSGLGGMLGEAEVRLPSALCPVGPRECARHPALSLVYGVTSPLPSP